MDENNVQHTENERSEASSEAKKPSIAELQWILDRTTSYVRDIDSKNGIILAALAVAAAVLFSNEWFCDFLGKAAGSASAPHICLLVLLAVSFAWCLISLFASLIPRTRACGSDHSLIYSGGIARFGGFEAYSLALNRSVDVLSDDLEEQIYINAVIAEKKILWHSRSLKGLAVFISLLAAFCFLGSVIWRLG